jgi:hypothetical protein
LSGSARRFCGRSDFELEGGGALEPTATSSLPASSGVPVALGRVDAIESRAGLRQSRRGTGFPEAERAE